MRTEDSPNSRFPEMSRKDFCFSSSADVQTTEVVNEEVAYGEARMPSISRLLLAVTLVASVASTQTVNVKDYLSLGAFAKWRVLEDGGGTSTVVVAVKKTTVKDGQLRYATRFPVFDSVDSASVKFGYDEDGRLVIHSAAFELDSFEGLSAKKIAFNPPLLVGDVTEALGGDPIVNTVDEVMEVKVHAGPLKKPVDVAVTGTLTVRWLATGDEVTPLGTYSAASLARIQLAFVLNFSGEGVSKDLSTTIEMIVGDKLGLVALDSIGDENFGLEKAILSGKTLGDFPTAVVDLTELTFDTPGMLTLQGAADDETTGGDFVFTVEDLRHDLSGRLELEGTLAPDDDLEATVDVTLVGRAKLSKKDGSLRLSLKGKAKLPSVSGNLTMKVKATVTEDTESLTIAYRAGKDVVGNMVLGVTPRAGEEVTVTVDGMVDTDLEPKKTRSVGSQGTLTLGDATWVVTLVDKVRTKGDNPSKRKYLLKQIGTRASVLRMSATATDESDYALTSFRARMFRFKTGPKDPADVDVTVE